MRQLKSGIFFINTKHFELCDPHVTRFSLNFNLDSSQSYFIESRKHTVDPGRYLIINEGQQFRTSAASEVSSRMLTIAYEVGLPSKMYSTLTSKHEALVDDPTSAAQELYVFDKTQQLSMSLMAKAVSLCNSRNEHTGIDLGNDLEDLLEDVLISLIPVQKQMLALTKVRVSTRKELFKRLHWVREYIESNYQYPLTIGELANIACLSQFHFKRVFKDAFNQPPYQYIKSLRLSKAKELLSTGLSVKETCLAVGWDDPSSFVRLFRQTFNITPSRYKLQQFPKL